MVEIHRGFDSLSTFNKKYETTTKKGRTTMNISSYRAVDTLFGLSIKESTKQRKAERKQQIQNTKPVQIYKPYLEDKCEGLANKWGAKFIRGTK